MTKGFVYSSFLKPYNPRRSQSDVSVGSHSSNESEHSSSSPHSSTTLTLSPSRAAVAFTHKPPQDSASLGELCQSPQSPSEMDSPSSGDRTAPLEAGVVTSPRRYSRPEPGYSPSPRNGHPTKAHLRSASLVEDRDSGLKSGESEGNQVSPEVAGIWDGSAETLSCVEAVIFCRHDQGEKCEVETSLSW